MFQHEIAMMSNTVVIDCENILLPNIILRILCLRL